MPVSQAGGTKSIILDHPLFWSAVEVTKHRKPVESWFRARTKGIRSSLSQLFLLSFFLPTFLRKPPAPSRKPNMLQALCVYGSHSFYFLPSTTTATFVCFCRRPWSMEKRSRCTRTTCGTPTRCARARATDLWPSTQCSPGYLPPSVGRTPSPTPTPTATTAAWEGRFRASRDAAAMFGINKDLHP